MQANGNTLPRVSMIVLGYNQAALIDRAIDAAFAQDYGNLEIVLSDDGSKDDTYERMQARAAAYTGTHIVKVNRTPQNHGTLAHIYNAFGQCTGGLILLAAGDDMSVPHRASRLAQVWQETGADCIDSNFDLIDGIGTVIETNYSNDALGVEALEYFAEDDLRYVHGASSAYSAKVFQSIVLPDDRIACEDEFLSLFLNFRSRRIERVPEALVRYRRHEGSASNFSAVSTSSAIIDREFSMMSLARSMHNTLKFFETAIVDGRGYDQNWGVRSKVDVGLVRSDKDYWLLRSTWTDTSFLTRIMKLAGMRRASHRKWMLPRLLGLHAFVRLKLLTQRVRTATS